MKDFEEVACLSYKNAKRLGYTDLSKEAIIEHLQGEIEELKVSRKAPDNIILKFLSCQEDDNKFMEIYEDRVKDSEVCELLDFIFVSLTRLFELGISINYAIRCKLRYNKLRSVKNDNKGTK